MADYLLVLEKEKRCTFSMDSGKTFDNTSFTLNWKNLDNLVWTQNIYTKILE